MSRFATQLATALDKTDLTRVRLSELTGLPYSTLTNYALDRTPPDVDAMRIICSALPPEEAAELLVARLADECPSEFKALIRLEPRDPTLSQDALANLPELPPKLREALDVIARAAALTNEWHELVLDLANVARPVIAPKYPLPKSADLAAAEDAAPYGKRELDKTITGALQATLNPTAPAPTPKA